MIIDNEVCLCTCLNRKMLQNYDPFKKLKYNAFDKSETTMIAIAEFLIFQFSKKELNDTSLKALFIKMLKVRFICLELLYLM